MLQGDPQFPSFLVHTVDQRANYFPGTADLMVGFKISKFSSSKCCLVLKYTVTVTDDYHRNTFCILK